jgi:hypothetical protein
MENMYEESPKKIKALLYWYIFGVPACLIFFAFILFMIDFPILIGISFLMIILYTGIVGILVIIINATIFIIKDKGK